MQADGAHPMSGHDEERPEDSDQEEQAAALREDQQDSFVQQLHRRFGKDVDPAITLQHEDDPSSMEEPGEEPGAEAEAQADEPEEDAGREESSTSRGLIRRLADQVSAGPRYRVRRELARGGMGTILRVWDEDLRRNLAMKVMHSSRRFDDDSQDCDVDQEKLGRFLEEAQITGQLDHPGIVPVHDLGIDDRGRLYFTMRLVRGRELKEVLDLAHRREEGWTKTRALGLILRVCESMAFAHSKGVVHRDLKPANVMVGRFGEVYVMDWGLARVLGRDDSTERRPQRPEDASSLSLVRTVRKDESELNPDSPLVTMDGDVVGTPSYMALEQARGKLELVGPRSDVYSLGAILYYMLAGKAPYVEPGERISPHTVLNRVLQDAPESVAKLAPAEPAELIAICEKAMSRAADERYGSMLEVAEDIQAYLENRVVGAYEGGALAEFRKWVGRNRGMAAAVAGMIILSIASALGFAWQTQNQVEQLTIQQEETRQAKEAAEDSEAQAQANLVLAQDREEEAKDNAQRASQNAREARRSGYIANVLAADFSLKLDDVVETRARLLGCDAELRGWEWDHLRLKANAPVRSLGRVWSGGVDEIAVTPDGETILTLARNGRLRFYDLESGDPVEPGVVALTFGTTGPITPTPLDMDLAADGSRVVVVGNDAHARIYDTRSGGTPLLELPKDDARGHDSRISSASFSRDGRYLATGADNGSIIVWDDVGDIVGRFAGHVNSVADVSWSPDSRFLASASVDGTVRVWEAALRTEMHVLRGHQGAVWGVAWSGRGERLFSVGADGTVNQWNSLNGRLLASWAGHGAAIRSADYDPELELLVTASEDRTVRVWDVATGDSIVLRGHEAGVNHAEFVPDGRTLITCAQDGAVEIWDSRGDLAETDFVFRGVPLHSASIGSIAFSPDGTQLLTAADDRELVLWDSLAGMPLRRLRGHENIVYQAEFGPAGRRIFSASHDHTVRRWDVETGQVQAIFQHAMRVTAVAVTPDGSRVITGCADNVVRIFDAQAATELASLPGPSTAVVDIAVSADGTRFATCSNDLRLWTLGQEEPDFIVRQHLRSIAFSPDGTRLVGASARLRRPVYVFDAATGETIHELRDHEGSVRAVAYAPDGSRFASGSDGGEVRIRDAESGQTLLVLEWPDQTVTGLAFSPDGTRLAAGSRSGAARIWETGPVRNRRARWNEMQELDEEAQPLVDRLFDERFFLDDVLLAVQGDTELSPALRENAIRLAYLHGDDPAVLHRRCMEESMPAGRSPEVYERALRRAQAALTLTEGRDDQHVLLALGMAQARSNLHRDAVRTLEEAGDVEEERPAFSSRETAVRLLFLALARFNAGETQRSGEALGLAQRQFQATPGLAADDALRALLGEVEDLLAAETGT